ncbi:MAG: sensor histidine kinase [Thermoanaerobaculia bacterium]
MKEKTPERRPGNPVPGPDVSSRVERVFVPLTRILIPRRTPREARAAKFDGEPRVRTFWKRTSANVAVWTVAGFFFASQLYFLYPIASGREMSFTRALLINLPFYYLWAVLTPAILWLARRFPIERAGWKRPLLIHLGASASLSAVQLFLAGTVLHALADATANRSSSLWLVLAQFFRLNFHANVLTYWALVGLAWGADTYAKYRDRELAASQLETQLAQAELGALKMQLQPHFLFNTLNAIAALLKANPDAAEGMILQLSDFLRLTLKNTGRPDVSLREELEFLERYLAIEKTRFQDRLLTRFRIRSEVLDARVPNLILQPLVENAIRHGIARDHRAGRLEVSASHEGGRLLLRVSDDGPGAPPGHVTEGIGLSNTRERLRHLFGDAYSLEYGNAPGGGFLVSVTLPFVSPGNEPSSP